MSKPRFNFELLWENIVGIICASLFLAIVLYALFVTTKESFKESVQKPTPTLSPDKVISAKSVTDKDVEKLYEQKRKELAEKKAVEEREKRRIEKEQQELIERKKQLELSIKKKHDEAEEEKRKIQREKEALVQKKERAEQEQKKAELKKKQAEVAEKKAIEKKRLAEEASQKAAQEQKKIEQERKKAEAERQHIAKEKKAEAKKRKQEEAKKKAAEEMKRKEQAVRERVAKEKKRKAEMEKEKAEAEKQRIAQELAADIVNREAEEGEAQARTQAITRYSRAITDKIKRRWVIPAKLPQGLSATIQIKIGSGGAVRSARITRSSGNLAFDTSAIQAVKQASPLPLPDNKKWAAEFEVIDLNFP